jgi:hypothetical protein
MSRREDKKRIAMAKRVGGISRRAGSKKGYRKGCSGKQGR